MLAEGGAVRELASRRRVVRLVELLGQHERDTRHGAERLRIEVDGALFIELVAGQARSFRLPRRARGVVVRDEHGAVRGSVLLCEWDRDRLDLDGGRIVLRRQPPEAGCVRLAISLGGAQSLVGSSECAFAHSVPTEVTRAGDGRAARAARWLLAAASVLLVCGAGALVQQLRASAPQSRGSSPGTVEQPQRAAQSASSDSMKAAPRTAPPRVTPKSTSRGLWPAPPRSSQQPSRLDPLRKAEQCPRGDPLCSDL